MQPGQPGAQPGTQPPGPPNSKGLWICYKLLIWIPTWILYETPYESHMDLIPYLTWIVVGILLWILYGSYMDPHMDLQGSL